MKKFITGIILISFVLGGCTNMAKNKKSTAEKFPENLLIDSYVGSACNGKLKIEMEITAAVRQTFLDQYEYPLFGTYRSIDSQGQTSETYIRGEFRIPRNSLSGPSFMALYAGKAPTLKDYIEYMYGTGSSGRMAYEKAKNSKEVLAEFEKYFRASPFGNDATSAQPGIALAMDIARDTEGKGWIGSFASEGFDDCNEIVLTSKSGKNTSQLPPVTGDMALGIPIIGNSNKREDHLIRRLYWLKVAEQKGHVEAPFRIAKFLEKLGKKSPQSYLQALQYYRSIAEKTGDQRAQMALANMYAEGRGTPVNPAEAKKWRDLANITLNEATKICALPEIIKVVYAIDKKMNDNAKVLAIFTSMYTGIAINPGTIRVSEIVVGNVIAMDKPFECDIYGETVGVSADASNIPNVEYYAVNGFGNYTYQGNNSGDKAFANMVANLANSLANRPYKGKIKIEPLGGSRYKLTKSSYSATLDLQTGKSNNVPQNLSSKEKLPDQKEQQIEQNPRIDDWAKDYFNKQ